MMNVYHRYIQSKLRTPDGRPVVILNIDTTDLCVDQAQDAFSQMRTYSGSRGKQHCLLFSTITDTQGAVVCTTPGPNISCTPRGGDGTSLGVQFGLVRDPDNGFTTLLRGTEDIGTCLNMDRGYLFIAHNVNLGDYPSVLQFCQENNILPIYRTILGEYSFRSAYKK